jgi:hypothetical protein
MKLPMFRRNKILIERIIIRDEVTNLGIIISALNRVKDIENHRHAE